MNRLEKAPRKTTPFNQLMGFIGVLVPILLSEVTVQMPENAVYSEPFLAKGSKQPILDSIRNTLEIARNTIVAIVINGINYIIYDHYDRIHEPYAVLRFNGAYEISRKNILGIRDGQSEELSNKGTTKIRGNVFTHHT